MPDEKIVGGIIVGDLSERPYQVAFEYLDSLRCGGAIIGDNVVLTAAHCCDGVYSEFVTVRAGTLQKEEGGEVQKSISINLRGWSIFRCTA